MLDKLLELLTHCWEEVTPCEVLAPYTGGVVLRLGLYHRTVGPGVAWKWPLVERLLTVNTCVDTFHLPPQTITTADLVQVGISTIVRYRIEDVRPFLLDVQDQQTVLCDVTLGLTRKVVERLTFQALVTTDWEKEVRDKLQRRVDAYGVKILEVTYADLGKMRSLRLLGHQRAS
jgi:membrane protease subunit HflK